MIYIVHSMNPSKAVEAFAPTKRKKLWRELRTYSQEEDTVKLPMLKHVV